MTKIIWISVAIGIVLFLIIQFQVFEHITKPAYFEDTQYCEQDSDCKPIDSCGCSCGPNCVNKYNWEDQKCISMCNRYCPSWQSAQKSCGCVENRCQSDQDVEAVCNNICDSFEKSGCDLTINQGEFMIGWEQLDCSSKVDCSCEIE